MHIPGVSRLVSQLVDLFNNDDSAATAPHTPPASTQASGQDPIAPENTWPTLLSTGGFHVTQDWEAAPNNPQARYDELRVVQKDKQGVPNLEVYQNSRTGITTIKTIVSPQHSTKFELTIDTKKNRYNYTLDDGAGAYEASGGSLDTSDTIDVAKKFGVSVHLQPAVPDGTIQIGHTPTQTKQGMPNVSIINHQMHEVVTIGQSTVQSGSGQQLAVFHYDANVGKQGWIKGTQESPYKMQYVAPFSDDTPRSV